MHQKIVLFVCGHNAGRSQMAEAYFNAINKNPLYKAVSCGTHPSEAINPIVKNLLEDQGIDTSHLFPKKITTELEKNAEHIFTMGCGVERCCFSQDRNIEDWNLLDPNGKGKKIVEEVFIEVKKYVEALVQSIE